MRYASWILETQQTLTIWRRTEGARDLQVTAGIYASFSGISEAISVGGAITYIGDGGAIWAQSRMLKVSTDSSATAEIVAAAENGKTPFFVCNFLEYLTDETQLPVIIEQDNSSTIQLLL